MGTSHEVVLFYGESEDDLRRTHARYCHDLAELAERVLNRTMRPADAESPETATPA